MANDRALVQYEVTGSTARITLDAPPLNILTASMMDQLEAALERADRDRTLTAVAICANGKAFSAGADVGEHRPEQAPAMIASFSRLFRRLGAIELPLVMVVDGAALGGGFEIAMMADVLLASDRAAFGQPEIRLGFFAPVGVAWLARRIGAGRAVEVTGTGRTYSAAEMHAMGLVTRVVAPSELDAAMTKVLTDLGRASPAVMRLNVRMIRTLGDRPFEAARLEAERVFLGELMNLADVREGIASFAEKRAPVWSNS